MTSFTLVLAPIFGRLNIAILTPAEVFASGVFVLSVLEVSVEIMGKLFEMVFGILFGVVPDKFVIEPFGGKPILFNPPITHKKS